MEGFSYKGGCVDVDVHVLSHLKEELSWAVDKCLRVISNLKNNRSAKELKGTKE